MIKANINVVKNRISDLVNSCNSLVSILDKYQMLDGFTTLTTQQNTDVINLVDSKASIINTAYNSVVAGFQATETIEED